MKVKRTGRSTRHFTKGKIYTMQEDMVLIDDKGFLRYYPSANHGNWEVVRPEKPPKEPKGPKGPKTIKDLLIEDTEEPQPIKDLLIEDTEEPKTPGELLKEHMQVVGNRLIRIGDSSDYFSRGRTYTVKESGEFLDDSGEITGATMLYPGNWEVVSSTSKIVNPTQIDLDTIGTRVRRLYGNCRLTEGKVYTIQEPNTVIDDTGIKWAVNILHRKNWEVVDQKAQESREPKTQWALLREHMQVVGNRIISIPGALAYPFINKKTYTVVEPGLVLDDSGMLSSFPSTVPDYWDALSPVDTTNPIKAHMLREDAWLERTGPSNGDYTQGKRYQITQPGVFSDDSNISVEYMELDTQAWCALSDIGAYVKELNELEARIKVITDTVINELEARIKVITDTVINELREE